MRGGIILRNSGVYRSRPFPELVHPPVILIGMHRSGTSMVTRLLESMGLFVGSWKDKNHEATFFQRINQWLLTQCGGSWDNPGAVHYLLLNPEIRNRTASYIVDSLLESPRIASYLGFANYLRYRSVYRLNVPWGWKDPRNTYTLPLWLDLFPGAKVIHIRRQGIDVASSLQRRGRGVSWRHRFFCRAGLVHRIRSKSAILVRSPRCESLQGGYSLWQEYLAEASQNLHGLHDRVLELDFEQILADPRGWAQALAHFCGLTDFSQVRAAAAMVRSPAETRAFSVGLSSVTPFPK